ncbi:MAG: M23 family metallopeptidase [Acidobacteriota bacterium]
MQRQAAADPAGSETEPRPPLRDEVREAALSLWRGAVGLSFLLLMALAVWGALDLDRRARDRLHPTATPSNVRAWDALVETTPTGEPPPSASVDGLSPGPLVPGARLPGARLPVARLPVAQRPGPRAITGDGASVVFVDQLRARRLMVPVRDVGPAKLVDSYDEPRGGGSRVHRAIDIMAPVGTEVLAVEDGTIVSLAESRLGGRTIVQLDLTRTFRYSYAHLDRIARGLEEGDRVRRGQVIGTVGSTGNASADAPHLHFAVAVLDDDARWWDGDPLNPFDIWRP